MLDNKKKRYHNPKNNGALRENEAPRYESALLDLTLGDLGVSAATVELMAKNNIKCAADLCRRTERDMYRIQNLNKRTLFELIDALKSKEMTFKPEPERQAGGEATQQKDVSSRNGQVKRPVSDAPKAVNAVYKSPDAKKYNENRADRNTKNSNESGSNSFKREIKQGSSRFATAGAMRNDFSFKNDASFKNDGAFKNENRNRKPDLSPRKDVKEAIREKPEKLTEPLPIEQWRKIQKSGKWGFYDGFKTVIPCMYDEIFYFKEGFASVENEEHCGYIDRDNNLVIPLIYETALSFSEGLASVVKDGLCGYIDKQNNVVIPFQFEAATPFEGGEAKIKKDGRWGTIDTIGGIKWI